MDHTAGRHIAGKNKQARRYVHRNRLGQPGWWTLAERFWVCLAHARHTHVCCIPRCPSPCLTSNKRRPPSAPMFSFYSSSSSSHSSSHCRTAPRCRCTCACTWLEPTAPSGAGRHQASAWSSCSAHTSRRSRSPAGRFAHAFNVRKCVFNK